MELAGRTVMVTGASGGIGEPLCAALIAAGARVLAVGRNEGRLRRLAQHLPAGALSWVAADVATDEGRAQVVRAAAAFGERAPPGPLGRHQNRALKEPVKVRPQPGVLVETRNFSSSRL